MNPQKVFRFWWKPEDRAVQFVQGRERLKQFVAGLISGYGFGQFVNREDYVFLVHLFGHHPNWRDKFDGGGLRAVEVKANPTFNPRGMNGHRTLFLHRADGTSVPASWQACIYPPNPAEDAKKAFRCEIDGSIIRFKQREFDARGGRTATWGCPITGAPISWNSCEVDHLPPWEFAAILRSFLEEWGLRLEAIKARSTSPGVYCLESRALAQEWVMQHDSLAKLQVLSTDGHRKVTRERKAGQTVPNGTK